MSKKPIIGGIILAAIIGVVFVGTQINPDNPENEEVVFHVTLADPTLYECMPAFYGCKDIGKEYRYPYLNLEEGVYMFGFVANGDSPQKLSIILNGKTSSGGNLYREFILKGIPSEEEGTVLWYTWDYDGQKEILIPSSAGYEIKINPNGDLMGPVSVDLIKLR